MQGLRSDNDMVYDRRSTLDHLCVCVWSRLRIAPQLNFRYNWYLAMGRCQDEMSVLVCE